jgi:apolipoprotein N-acyltransferase
MTGSFNLIGASVGLVLILGGFYMAYVQKVLGGTHVIVLALGAVLAGVTNVQFSVGPNGDVSATIGAVKEATAQNVGATQQQAQAIDALRARVDSLETAIKAQQVAAAATQSPQQTATVNDALQLSARNNQTIIKSLAQSRVFTQRAQVLVFNPAMLKAAQPAQNPAP